MQFCIKVVGLNRSYTAIVINQTENDDILEKANCNLHLLQF